MHLAYTQDEVRAIRELRDAVTEAAYLCEGDVYRQLCEMQDKLEQMEIGFGMVNEIMNRFADELEVQSWDMGVLLEELNYQAKKIFF